MRERENLQHLERNPLLTPARGVHKPGWRVEHGRLDITDKGNAGIDRRVPLRKAALLERLKGVALQRVMVALNV
jgi:hypothetical protein